MIPAGKVVTEVVEQGKELSEFATQMPAQDYSTGPKTIDPIVQALQGNPKLSTIEKLVKAAGCKLVKPYGFILENSGKVITVSQVINYYGINTTGPVRCPICKNPFTYDTILFHLEQKYESGHSLKSKYITKLFEQRWYNWEYTDGNFYDGREKIEEWKN